MVRKSVKLQASDLAGQKGIDAKKFNSWLNTQPVTSDTTAESLIAKYQSQMAAEAEGFTGPTVKASEALAEQSAPKPKPTAKTPKPKPTAKPTVEPTAKAAEAKQIVEPASAPSRREIMQSVKTLADNGTSPEIIKQTIGKDLPDEVIRLASEGKFTEAERALNTAVSLPASHLVRPAETLAAQSAAAEGFTGPAIKGATAAPELAAAVDEAQAAAASATGDAYQAHLARLRGYTPEQFETYLKRNAPRIKNPDIKRAIEAVQQERGIEVKPAAQRLADQIITDPEAIRARSKGLSSFVDSLPEGVKPKLTVLGPEIPTETPAPGLVYRGTPAIAGTPANSAYDFAAALGLDRGPGYSTGIFNGTGVHDAFKIGGQGLFDREQFINLQNRLHLGQETGFNLTPTQKAWIMNTPVDEAEAVVTRAGQNMPTSISDLLGRNVASLDNARFSEVLRTQPELSAVIAGLPDPVAQRVGQVFAQEIGAGATPQVAAASVLEKIAASPAAAELAYPGATSTLGTLAEQALAQPAFAAGRTGAQMFLPGLEAAAAHVAPELGQLSLFAAPTAAAASPAAQMAGQLSLFSAPAAAANAAPAVQQSLLTAAGQPAYNALNPAFTSVATHGVTPPVVGAANAASNAANAAATASGTAPSVANALANQAAASGGRVGNFLNKYWGKGAFSLAGANLPADAGWFAKGRAFLGTPGAKGLGLQLAAQLAYDNIASPIVQNAFGNTEDTKGLDSADVGQFIDSSIKGMIAGVPTGAAVGGLPGAIVGGVGGLGWGLWNAIRPHDNPQAKAEKGIRDMVNAATTSGILDPETANQMSGEANAYLAYIKQLPKDQQLAAYQQLHTSLGNYITPGANGQLSPTALLKQLDQMQKNKAQNIANVAMAMQAALAGGADRYRTAMQNNQNQYTNYLTQRANEMQAIDPALANMYRDRIAIENHYGNQMMAGLEPVGTANLFKVFLDRASSMPSPEEQMLTQLVNYGTANAKYQTALNKANASGTGILAGTSPIG